MAKPTPPMLTSVEWGRFISKVEPEPMSGCWLWSGALNANGYGVAWVRGEHYKAYRVAYEHLSGSIPVGMTIDHICRVRSCVNPSHMEPVSQRENSLRGISPCAKNARKTHCIRGHLLGGENASPFSVRLGHRGCRECARIRAATWRAMRRSVEHGQLTGQPCHIPEPNEGGA